MGPVIGHKIFFASEKSYDQLEYFYSVTDHCYWTGFFRVNLSTYIINMSISSEIRPLESVKKGIF